MPFQASVTDPTPLLAFCRAQWPDIKNTQWKQWLKHGALRVNGHGVYRHDHLLHPGDEVQIETRKYAAPATALPSGIRIVHEDDCLLVVEKPSGLLSISSARERERTLYWKLNALLRARRPQRPERVFIVHRLDQETSGIMVFAKTVDAKNALQDHWDEVTKTYAAIVEGHLPAANGRLEHFLDESDPIRVTIRPSTPATRRALSIYRVIRTEGTRSLVEVEIETGRRHQIRVQLAAVGCPIVGDRLYGAQTNPAGRIALHALRLSFTQPETRQPMTWSSRLPSELRRCLAAESPEPPPRS